MTSTQRRIVFSALVLLTMVFLLGLLLISFSLEGYSIAEWIMIGCFVITLPWTVIGFWNAVIGFILFSRQVVCLA